MRIRAGWMALLAVPAFGQSVSVHEELLHGRHALVLENAQMRVAELPGGGFIGEVRFKSDDPDLRINPMRVPHYPTIDPYSYDLARDGARYGTGMQRRLMSGYMGQFLAFPQFAASSPAELAQDYGQHGEAIAVKWMRTPAPADALPQALSLVAELPKTQYRIERTIELPADETVAYITETVENQVPYDRPVQWVQHVTFGPPFVALDKTFADASVEHTVTGRGAQASLGDWPQGMTADGLTDFRAFSGHTHLWLMDRSRSKVYFTLYNTDYKVLIGYLFDAASNPWVLDWQENHSMTETPWDGQVVARGICIGDSVMPGIRSAVTPGSLFGVPTVSWIDARARRTQHYAVFLMQIPVGFQGVADLKAEAGAITITERTTGRQYSIKSAHLW